MDMTWDLEILYKGYDDPKYKKDLKSLDDAICEIIDFSKNLDSSKLVETIEKYLQLEEKLSSLIDELYTYSALKSSTNVNDYEALEQIGTLQLKLQETLESGVIFSKFLKDLDLDSLAKESSIITTYLFKLKQSQNE